MAMREPIPAVDIDLFIGRDSSGARYYFDGLIDEVRLSSVARYTSDFVPAPRLSADQDTVALWSFDGEGDVAQDSSGNGHHGVIVGATRSSVAPCAPTPDAGVDDSGLPGYVIIPAGGFTMGAPVGEPGSRSDEQPQHPVTITTPFWLKATPVTQDEWAAVAAAAPAWPMTNPSWFGPNGGGARCGGTCPVERVSWWDAVAWLNKLSTIQGLQPCYDFSGGTCSGTPGDGCAPGLSRCTGTYWCTAVRFEGLTCTGYRLPTEAEWEYATRAGATTGFWNGVITSTASVDPVLEASGWYARNSGNSARPVAQKLVSPWGLYDVHGNVWEFVHDWHGPYGSIPATDPTGGAAGSARVARGGAWNRPPQDCRSAIRGAGAPPGRYPYFGFRSSRSRP